MPDAQLLTRIARGNQPAFAELYRRYAERVYNTVLSYVQNAPDAEEVTQNVFVRIHRKAGQFSGNSKVSTWVYRIAVNASLNRLRKRTAKRHLDTEAPTAAIPDFEHPGILLEKREAARQLFGYIYALPEQQKTAFILSYVEELPRQEVADIMETTLKAVESLLHRGQTKFAQATHSFPSAPQEKVRSRCLNGTARRIYSKFSFTKAPTACTAPSSRSQHLNTSTHEPTRRIAR